MVFSPQLPLMTAAVLETHEPATYVSLQEVFVYYCFGMVERNLKSYSYSSKINIVV